MVVTKVPSVTSKFAKFIEGVENFWIQKPRSKIQETTEHSFTYDPKSTELLVFSIYQHSQYTNDSGRLVCLFKTWDIQ